jgi:hypothetical protein
MKKSICKQKIQNTNPKKKNLKPYYLPIYEKINVQMLLYTLTKKFIEVQGNMLNAFSIILFYKMMCGGLMAKTLVRN